MNTKESLENMKFLTSSLLLKIYISKNEQCRYYFLKSFPENKETKTIYFFFEKVKDDRQEIRNHLKLKNIYDEQRRFTHQHSLIQRLFTIYNIH